MATILVIDDHEPIRTLLRVVLEGAGYKVLEAPNGRLGLELYCQRPADLVITDMSMPEMSGLNLMLELARHSSDAKIIAISGDVEGKQGLNMAKLLGARQTFQKPFDMQQLLSAVQYELGVLTSAA